MLMIRSAHERRGADCAAPTLRSVGRGITIGAVLVAFSAFAEEIHTGIAPQHSVQAPASPASPTPPTVPTAPTAPGAPPWRSRLHQCRRIPATSPASSMCSAASSATRPPSSIRSSRAPTRPLGHLGSQTSDAAKDAALGAAGTAKGAAGTLMGLPNARIVTGRERCVIAPNGVPDCRAAADAACRGKGFGSGRSLDTQSAQKCPARVWLSGRLPAEGDCPLETFVTRAVCQ